MNIDINHLLKDPRFLENVLETMSDGLMVVDREGTILSFNPAAEQITWLPARRGGRPPS